MTTAGAFFAAADTLPVATLHDITGGAALILAPHPDDESLGCGGLIAHACSRGEPPLVVVLTDGAGSHPNSRTHPPDRLRMTREAETLQAVACLGLPAERVVFLRYPDTAAPNSGPGLTGAVAAVGALFHAHGCRSLLAPWRRDPHCDHEAAARIAAGVGAPGWAYPVWGRTLSQDTELGETNGVRLDVAPWQDAKRRAIACHRSQWAGVIADDPDGFQMPPDFMSLFDTPYELFLSPT